MFLLVHPFLVASLFLSIESSKLHNQQTFHLVFTSIIDFTGVTLYSPNIPIISFRLFLPWIEIIVLFNFTLDALQEHDHRGEQLPHNYRPANDSSASSTQSFFGILIGLFTKITKPSTHFLFVMWEREREIERMIVLMLLNRLHFSQKGSREEREAFE